MSNLSPISKTPSLSSSSLQLSRVSSPSKEKSESIKSSPRPQSFKPSPTPDMGGLLDLSSIESKIDDIAPEQIRKKTLSVPMPSGLISQKQDDKPGSEVQTLDKTSMRSLVKANFGKMLKNMDGSWLRKDHYRGDALKRGIKIIQNAPPQSDLAWTVILKSDSELKEMIAAGIGDLKTKHQGKSYSELSDNKQKLVDSIVEGLKQGLTTEQRQMARSLSQTSGVTAPQVLAKKDLMSEIREKASQVSKPTKETLEKLDTMGGKTIEVAKAKIKSDHEAITRPVKFTPEDSTAVSTEISRSDFKKLFAKVNTQDSYSPEELKLAKESITQSITEFPDSEKLTWTLSMKSVDDMFWDIKDQILPDVEDKKLTDGQKQMLTGLANHALEVGLERLKTVAPDKLVSRNEHGDPNEITIKGKKYSLTKTLGQGGFGRALEFVSEEGDKVVLKRFMKKETHSNEKWFKNMQVEIRQHRNAMGVDGEGHENVLNLKGIIFEPGKDGLGEFFTITEAAGLGETTDVNENLNDMEYSGLLSDTSTGLLKRLILKDALDGMSFLQKNRQLLHLDLKPENIFMTEDGVAKIADFGLAKTTSQLGDKELHAGGTAGYMSPEVSEKFIKDVDNHTNIDYNSDTWSMGVLAKELMTGSKSIPQTGGKDRIEAAYDFAKDKSNRIYEAPKTHVDDKSGKTIHDETHSAFQKVINSMLHPDPEKRPTLEVLAQHEFFNDPVLANPEIREALKELGSIKGTKSEYGFTFFSKEDQAKIKQLNTKLEKLATL